MVYCIQALRGYGLGVTQKELVDCSHIYLHSKKQQPSKDVKRSTPTQQPTIPWSSLLRQRPRQCSRLQLTQQGWENYQQLFCSLSPYSEMPMLRGCHQVNPRCSGRPKGACRPFAYLPPFLKRTNHKGLGLNVPYAPT